MKLWKRKFKNVAAAKTKAANKIAAFIGQLKTACALYLGKKINPLSLAKALVTFGFSVLLAFYSVLLLVAPLRTKQKDVAIKVEPIQFPKQQSKEKQLRPDVFISDETYKRIHFFKLYLDSLAKDETGRRLYDSILVMHPGITDSLQQVEDYYQLQK